jgi:hypothetical protein
MTLHNVLSCMPLVHLSDSFGLYNLLANVIVLTPLHFNQIVGSVPALGKLIFPRSCECKIVCSTLFK